jgi:hypothetical protein
MNVGVWQGGQFREGGSSTLEGQARLRFQNPRLVGRRGVLLRVGVALSPSVHVSRAARAWCRLLASLG